jgi:hypothetical protein
MMSTREFSKPELAVGIALTFGSVLGLVIGSLTDNMGLWIAVGVTFGMCIGATCVVLLR